MLRECRDSAENVGICVVIRLAEWEIAQISERYDVFSKESLYQAIQSGDAGHLAWEDCIVWKNKEAHIARLRRMAGRE